MVLDTFLTDKSGESSVKVPDLHSWIIFSVCASKCYQRNKQTLWKTFQNDNSYHFLKVDQSLINKCFVPFVHHGDVFDQQGKEWNQRRSELGQE